MDKFKKIKKENTYNINIWCSYYFRVVGFVLLLSFIIVNAFQLFLVDNIFKLTSILFVFMVMWIPSLFNIIFKRNANFVKYIIVLCSIFFVSILYLLFSNYVVLLFSFPFFIACLYFENRLSIFSLIFNLIGLYTSHYLNFVMFNKQPLDNEFFILLSRTLEILFLFFICLNITNRNKKFIESNTCCLRKNIDIQNDIIIQFTSICESTSLQTGKHVKRTSEYVKILCSAAGMNEEQINCVSTASMMHDIGKIKIPENIIDKQGKLTKEEFDVIKTHVDYGELLLNNCSGDVMMAAKVIAKQHHEKWDGSGYLGLKGDEISLFARIMAVADVFDALVSKRSYKDEWTIDDAYNEVINCSGTHFDPYVIDLFKENFSKIKMVYEKNRD